MNSNAHESNGRSVPQPTSSCNPFLFKILSVANHHRWYQTVNFEAIVKHSWRSVSGDSPFLSVSSQTFLLSGVTRERALLTLYNHTLSRSLSSWSGPRWVTFQSLPPSRPTRPLTFASLNVHFITFWNHFSHKNIVHLRGLKNLAEHKIIGLSLLFVFCPACIRRVFAPYHFHTCAGCCVHLVIISSCSVWHSSVTLSSPENASSILPFHLCSTSAYHSANWATLLVLLLSFLSSLIHLFQFCILDASGKHPAYLLHWNRNVFNSSPVCVKVCALPLFPNISM